MRKKKTISWFLVAMMVISLFSSFQSIYPQPVKAELMPPSGTTSLINDDFESVADCVYYPTSSVSEQVYETGYYTAFQSVTTPNSTDSISVKNDSSFGAANSSKMLVLSDSNAASASFISAVTKSLPTPITQGSLGIEFDFSTSAVSKQAYLFKLLSSTGYSTSNSDVLIDLETKSSKLAWYSSTNNNISTNTLTNNKWYHVKVDVNMDALTYDVYLTPTGESTDLGNCKGVPFKLNSIAPGTITSATAKTISLATAGGFAGGIAFDNIQVYQVNAPPETATGISKAEGDGVIGLWWPAVRYASYYNILRSESPDGPFVAITTSGITTLPTQISPYKDTPVTNGTTYYYKIESVNNYGNTISDAISAVPSSLVTKPQAPSGITATARDSAVSLNWNMVSNASTYTLKRSTSADMSSPVLISSTLPYDQTSYYDHTGLTNGTTYYYTLSSSNISGDSADSTPLEVTPLVPLTAPKNLSNAASDGQVSLSWSAVTGASTYNVKRGTTNGGPYQTIARVSGATFTDPSVTNGNTYYYVVTAVKGDLESMISNQTTAAPYKPVSGAPSVPSVFTASAGDSRVSLSWNSATGATSYNIKRSTTSGGPYNDTFTSNSTSFTDVNVTNGTTYYYVVSAVNANGESQNAGELVVVPALVIVVAQDGSGDATTIQQAVNMVSVSNTQRTVIYIKPGTYREKVTVDRPYISFVGAGQNVTTIVYDDYGGTDGKSGNVGSTFKSQTVAVTADNFTATNLTIQNDASPRSTKGTAVALSVTGDKAVLDQVKILSHQDTLYTGGSATRSIRQYYRDCTIAGDVDFIFGEASAVVFDHNTLLLTSDATSGSSGGGHITAAAQYNKTDPGYVFLNCSVTTDVYAIGKYDLGRPWKNYSNVTYINTNIDVPTTGSAYFDPLGWGTSAASASAISSLFREYNSTGLGASPSTRVYVNPAYSKQMTSEEASALTIPTILSGWDPSIPVIMPSIPPIDPKVAVFDKDTSKQSDIQVTLNTYVDSITSITNGSYTLTASDYTDNGGNVYTISKSYLAKQPLGSTTLDFNLSLGGKQSLTIAITDSNKPLDKPTLQVSQNDGVVTLEWSSVAEAVYYNVYGMDSSDNVIKTVQIDAPTTSVAISSGLIDGTAYKFKVAAYRGNVTSESEVSTLTYAKASNKWQSSIFGSSTNTTDNSITLNPDNSVSISSINGKGKISNTADGIAYYYTTLDSSRPYQLTAKAHVVTFVTGNNQVSFGLMLRKAVGVNGDIAGHNSNFVAVGAYGQNMQAFWRGNEGGTSTVTTSIPAISPAPAPKPPPAGNEYTLRIIKRADGKCVVSIGSQTTEIDSSAFFTGVNEFYLGAFAARNAKVTFSDFQLVSGVESLELTSKPTKTEYFEGQDLDMTGSLITAVYANNSKAVLSSGDYSISGYSKDSVGTQTVTINFGGRTATFDVNVNKLLCTDIFATYLPAKTDYHIGDSLDTTGMVISGKFNTGITRVLEPSEYSITGFDSSSAGEKTVMIKLNTDQNVSTSFKATVSASELQSIEINKLPEKVLYFIGDELNLDGMVVYAKYSDNTQIRLMREELEVSLPDTSTSGEKDVLISYKGKTATFKVTVNQKQLSGIKILKYPKTTFFIGDSFDNSGLVLVKAYDDSTTEPVDQAAYSVDSSAFDSSKAGVYSIKITPTDTSISPISYNVSVRERMDYIWKDIWFGQSTSASNNYVTLKDNVVQVVALTGGGKVTAAQDGISFYYTEVDALKDNFVLSADIKVNAYAKDPYDGQESFGIMARDAIGTAGDRSIFASNIAAIGGYSGATTADNGTQLFVRTGVTSPDGAGSEGIRKIMLQNVKPNPTNTATNYRLTLAKTNSGFTGKLNNGTEEIFYTPDILNVQDSKIYVGFYAARVADIEVSNISFSVTAADTDAPKVEAPKEPVAPTLDILSLDKTPNSTYNLMLNSNVKGTITVKQGYDVLAQDKAVVGNQVVTIPATLTNEVNTFSIVFLPDDTQYLTSYDKIISNFTVLKKSYVPGGDIYVSTSGTSSGDGTQSKPLDLDTAVAFVKEGQKILVLDGTYERSTKLDIMKYNEGNASAKKYLFAADGAKPIIDFNKNSEGALLSGNYWHVKGIDFTQSAPNTKGFVVGGNYNIVENCRFYNNGDTGLSISRTDNSSSIALWPSYNLILNCTSYDNMDPSNNNADGFAAKIFTGVGNVFRGCISHNNIDDGWDLYTKAGSGAIGAVLIDGCIAYNNGTLTTGDVGQGDKNGFKLGGEGIAVPHIIRNSIAFDNGANGFTSNSNPAVQAFNNVSFDNAQANISFSSYTGIPLRFAISNFVSFRKNVSGTKDVYPSTEASDSNYFYNGTTSANKSGAKLKDLNFASLSSPVPYQRNTDGNIIWGDFLKFNAFPKPITTTSVQVNADGTDKEIAITKETVTMNTPITVSVPAQVTDAKLFVTDLLKPAIDNVVKTSSMPKVTISAATSVFSKPIEVALPEGVVISAPISGKWDGTINVPTLLANDSVTVTPDAGKKAAISTVLEVGYGDVTLTFDKAVRLLIPGQAGKSAGYYVSDTFTPITTTLTADTQTAGDALAAGGTGKIDVGSDLVIWTKQFTKFVTYTQTSLATKDATTTTKKKYSDDGFIPVATDGKPMEDTENPPQPDKYEITDINGHWAAENITKLISLGAIKGYPDRTFKPDNAITRAEFATILVKAFKLEKHTGKAFDDTVGHWANEHIATAQYYGIVSGYSDNRFGPDDVITREQMTVMIISAAKLTDLSEDKSFVDSSDISGWAKAAVGLAAKKGIISGYKDNSFRPQGKATRAEAVTVIVNAIK